VAVSSQESDLSNLWDAGQVAGKPVDLMEREPGGGRGNRICRDPRGHAEMTMSRFKRIDHA